MTLRIKRVYEPAAEDDGFRVLVDRLWPRGLSKTAAALDLWLRDAAPSNELRTWYNHDSAKWGEFRRRYFAELDANEGALAPLLEAATRGGRVTLVYSSREERLNNAEALGEYLGWTLH